MYSLMLPNLISYRSKFSTGHIGAQCSFWLTTYIKIKLMHASMRVSWVLKETHKVRHSGSL